MDEERGHLRWALAFFSGKPIAVCVVFVFADMTLLPPSVHTDIKLLRSSVLCFIQATAFSVVNNFSEPLQTKGKCIVKRVLYKLW